MLLFLTINMAAMTSCTNPQLVNTVSDNLTRVQASYEIKEGRGLGQAYCY